MANAIQATSNGTANGNFEILSVDEWEAQFKDVSKTYKAKKAYYSDEILPFDITVTMKNEYGQGAYFRIMGVEFLNEGMGFSIDDITSEKACTFIAREITPIVPFSGDGPILQDANRTSSTGRN